MRVCLHSVFRRLFRVAFAIRYILTVDNRGKQFLPRLREGGIFRPKFASAAESGREKLLLMDQNKRSRVLCAWSPPADIIPHVI